MSQVFGRYFGFDGLYAAMAASAAAFGNAFSLPDNKKTGKGTAGYQPKHRARSRRIGKPGDPLRHPRPGKINFCRTDPRHPMHIRYCSICTSGMDQFTRIKQHEADMQLAEIVGPRA